MQRRFVGGERYIILGLQIWAGTCEIPELLNPTCIIIQQMLVHMRVPHIPQCSFIYGRVNHCRLHCRLAKFRGMMRMGKYGAVIGQKTRFCACAQYALPGYGFLFSQSQCRISPFSSNPRNFAKRQCKRQWLTPPTLHLKPETLCGYSKL